MLPWTGAYKVNNYLNLQMAHICIGKCRSFEGVFLPAFAYANTGRKTPLKINFIYSGGRKCTAFLRHGA